MFNLNSGEVVLLVLAALLILGPARLPEYAAKLGQGVRYLRDLAEGAKGQLRGELGPSFDEIDWRQLDPRQYDPRRIVREALAVPPSDRRAAGGRPAPHPAPEKTQSGPGPGEHRPVPYDPSLPTPFDTEAT